MSEIISDNPPEEESLIHPVPVRYLRTCPFCGDVIDVSFKPSKVLDPLPLPLPVAVALKIPVVVIVNPVPTLIPPNTVVVAGVSVYETEPPPPPPAAASTHCELSSSL